MLDKLKSIAKDTAWLTIGATASVVYITYKAVDNMLKHVPEMMDFAQDTYSQVKSVLSKDDSCSEPLHDHHDGCPECDLDQSYTADQMADTYTDIMSEHP